MAEATGRPGGLRAVRLARLGALVAVGQGLVRTKSTRRSMRGIDTTW